jgi:hypothetical protein
MGAGTEVPLWARAVFAVLYLICSVAAVGILGWMLADESWKGHLVKKGLGRWVVDHRTGTTTFEVGPTTQEKP